MDQRIQQYLDEMIEVNHKINLTNIKTTAEADLLHIEDSLAVLPEMEQAPVGLYGDMGSGGGFPGVPLALETGRQTILIDSVQKKMKAVQGILEHMGIDNQISTYSGRIEELAKEMPERFAVLTARALSRSVSLLELASPLLQPGGHLICLKSHTTDEELDAAQSVEKETGMTLASRRQYYLSDGETYRETIVFQKASTPSIKLPRRIGMAQKKPLA